MVHYDSLCFVFFQAFSAQRDEVQDEMNFPAGLFLGLAVVSATATFTKVNLQASRMFCLIMTQYACSLHVTQSCPCTLTNHTLVEH